MELSRARGGAIEEYRGRVLGRVRDEVWDVVEEVTIPVRDMAMSRCGRRQTIMGIWL